MSDFFGCSGEGLIMTASGEFFDILNPTPDQVRIEDIAHSLSNIQRATGHFNRSWSVAQHSMLVSSICASMASKQGMSHDDIRTAALRGLLHDGSEAYICDIARPIKYLPELDGYRKIENVIQDCVYLQFGINPRSKKMEELVKVADNEALKYEFRHFMEGWAKMPWCHDADDYWSMNVADILYDCYAVGTKAAFLCDFKDLYSGENAATQGS